METPYIDIYKKEHLYDAAALFYRVFTASPWEYSWLAPEKIRAYFQDLEACPKFLGFIFIDNKKIIGVCLGSVSDYFISSQYDIKEFYLEADLQNKGLGSRFLQAIENELRNKEVDFMALYTRRSIAAYNFYLKNEYEVMQDTVMLTKFL